MVAPRVEVIEGRQTLIQASGSGLPQKLDKLLSELLTVTYRDDFTLAGTRPSCTYLREHRFRRFREGRWYARSGIRAGEVLDLSLLMCQDCGAVQVRDTSIDWLGGQKRPAADPPKRRDHVMDWYSGKRPAGREYR